MPTGMFTKESGRMVRPMALVCSLIRMGACMRGNGSMTSSMDLAQSLGITIKSSIQATSHKARNLGQVDSNLRAAIMKANF